MHRVKYVNTFLQRIFAINKPINPILGAGFDEAKNKTGFFHFVKREEAPKKNCKSHNL